MGTLTEPIITNSDGRILKPPLAAIQKAQLASDSLHAFVVLMVVMATTVLVVIRPDVVPGDLVGTVYGSAIGYAAGRAGSVKQAITGGIGGRRSTDDS